MRGGFRIARAAALTLGVGAAALPAASQADAPTAFSEASGARIAYTCHDHLFDGSEPEGICLIDPDGTERVRLDRDPTIYPAGNGGDSDPDWSPDGRRIAFIRGTDSGSHVFTMNADGSQMKQMTFGPKGATLPDWAPDGRRIAYYADGGVHVVDIQTGIVTRLNEREWGNGDMPVWRPGGGAIAFTSSRDGYCVPDAHGCVRAPQIYLMGERGEAPHPVTRDGDIAFYTPAWSPDGTRLAAGCTNSVCTLNADGSALVRLAPSAPWAYPAWSPDGRMIAFTAGPRPRDQEIQLIDAAGGTPRFLDFGAQPDWRRLSPAVAPPIVPAPLPRIRGISTVHRRVVAHVACPGTSETQCSGRIVIRRATRRGCRKRTLLVRRVGLAPGAAARVRGLAGAVRGGTRFVVCYAMSNESSRRAGRRRVRGR